MSFQQRCTVTEAGHARLLSLPLPLQEKYGLFQRQIVKIKDGHLKEKCGQNVTMKGNCHNSNALALSGERERERGREREGEGEG